MAPMTQTEFNKRFGAWAGAVNGQCLDLDGFPPEQPYQCHDVLLSLLVNVFGLPLGAGHAPGEGWTSEVWLQFPTYRPQLAEVFTKRVGPKGIKNGSVLFWGFGDPVYPYSHIAVALEPPRADGTVLCITQNPGCTHIERLPLSNLLGYLEPKITPDPPKKKWSHTVGKYTPTEKNRQEHTPGSYNLVAIDAQKPAAVTVAMGVGLHMVYAQINLSGTPGEDVEVALAVDLCESKGGKRIGEPQFIGAVTETLRKGVTKVGLTIPVTLTQRTGGRDERVRIYVKPLGKGKTKTTFVRWSDAKLA